MCTYRQEAPADLPAIERLLDQAFGPDRHKKASYAFRRGVPNVPDLARVAVDHAGRLVGTIRFWPIRVGGVPSLLLGPLGVEPRRRGEGIGRTLIRDTLALAAEDGARSVFLVGDPAYYRPLGFWPAGAAVRMPHESPARLHGRPLGSATTLPNGLITPASPILRATA
ncbi:MAG: N-acetyltransferase [Geminicoccaceae bacterium]|nr:MAG: N-acetyltransferase [Geminicoccaceae bacterium]